ncbi:hypothetical protein ALC56_01946 [Trachymyrmex septentrionalis]|uniref:Uncharacterized protein n=1 Tax=Trachymyrmex septentrionalis TaxID=34720 RepID=A0A195FUY9_9HYME|nr:hypothetical protein ALC56_01946 [Trachymyrmex septentrionalis]
MFPTEQPTHVRKEETSLSVMRISIGFAVFVMNPVVSGPSTSNDALDYNMNSLYLSSYKKESILSIHNHEYQLERPLGFVRSVCPESVSSGCDSQATDLIQ